MLFLLMTNAKKNGQQYFEGLVVVGNKVQFNDIMYYRELR